MQALEEAEAHYCGNPRTPIEAVAHAGRTRTDHEEQRGSTRVMPRWEKLEEPKVTQIL